MDDVIDLEFRHVAHENTLYSRPVMSTNIRQAILERNQAARNAPGAIRDLSFGRLAMSIPKLDWYWIKRKYPDLASLHKPTFDAALSKFQASSEAAPYLMR